MEEGVNLMNHHITCMMHVLGKGNTRCPPRGSLGYHWGVTSPHNTETHPKVAPLLRGDFFGESQCISGARTCFFTPISPMLTSTYDLVQTLWHFARRGLTLSHQSACTGDCARGTVKQNQRMFQQVCHTDTPTTPQGPPRKLSLNPL